MHSAERQDTKMQRCRIGRALTNDDDAGYWPLATATHSLLAAIDIEIWQFAIIAISFYFLAEPNASRIVAGFSYKLLLRISSSRNFRGNHRVMTNDGSLHKWAADFQLLLSRTSKVRSAIANS